MRRSDGSMKRVIPAVFYRILLKIASCMFPDMHPGTADSLSGRGTSFCETDPVSE